MSMVSQGYPLWAVESDGSAYAVVGWDEYQYPFLVKLGAPGAAARNPIEHERFTFTTTDPSPDAGLRAHMEALADELHGTECARLIRQRMDPTERPDDLRERMTRLADDLERAHGPGVGRAIRAELGK